MPKIMQQNLLNTVLNLVENKLNTIFYKSIIFLAYIIELLAEN